MPVQKKTADALDEVRRIIAAYETCIAGDRQTIRNSDAHVMKTKGILQFGRNALIHTRQQVETGHQVITTSQALLKQIAERERYWTNQVAPRTEPDGPSL